MNFKQIELYIFFIQQNLHQQVLQQVNNMTIVSGLVIFIGGVFTSFNPCMLSTFPIIVAYINPKRNNILYSLSFITGIMISLITTGILFFFIRKSSWLVINTLPIFEPLIAMTLGLSLLNFIETPDYNLLTLISTNHNHYTLGKIFTLGIYLGFTISPCSTPILITLLAWISYTNNIIIGIMLLIVYSFGYIFPILLGMGSVHVIQKFAFFSIQIYKIIPLGGFVILSSSVFSIFHIYFNKVIL